MSESRPVYNASEVPETLQGVVCSEDPGEYRVSGLPLPRPGSQVARRRTQLYIAWAAALLAISACLFPPWVLTTAILDAPAATHQPYGFHFLFRPPRTPLYAEFLDDYQKGKRVEHPDSNLGVQRQGVAVDRDRLLIELFVIALLASVALFTFQTRTPPTQDRA